MSEARQNQTRQIVTGIAPTADGKSFVENVVHTPFASTMERDGIPYGELRARDSTTGAVLWRMTEMQIFSAPETFHFLPDGTLLTGRSGGGISAVPIDRSMDGLHAWNGKTGEAVPFDIKWGNEVGTRESGGIEQIETSADGKRLLLSSGSGSQGVQIIDLDSKEVIGYYGSNSTVDRGPKVLSNDGRWLAVRTAKSISIYDLSVKRDRYGIKPLLRLPVESVVEALSFSPEGNLVAGFEDGRVMLWQPDFTG